MPESKRRQTLPRRVLAALRTPQGWVALVATALIGWTISYFGPKLFESSPQAFSVHVQPNPDKQITEPPTSYVVPRPIKDVGPPPAAKQEGPASPLAETCRDRYEWAHAMGGADLFASTAEVTLTGGPESTVEVTGQVHVVRRKSPFGGPILTCSGLGSGLSPLTICVDLTLHQLKFCPHGAHQKKPFVRQLASGEVEVLRLEASAKPPIAAVAGPDSVYEWTVDLVVSVSGKEHHYVVDDNGKPFRTYVTDQLARVERDRYIWADGSWQRPPSP